MLYKDALKYKLEKAKVLHTKLDQELDAAYKSNTDYDDTYDLRIRIAKVDKAIKHCENLLDELKGYQL